jgi:hypothetical protein
MSPVNTIGNVPLAVIMIGLVVWAVILITWKGKKS